MVAAVNGRGKKERGTKRVGVQQAKKKGVETSNNASKRIADEVPRRGAAPPSSSPASKSIAARIKSKSEKKPSRGPEQEKKIGGSKTTLVLVFNHGCPYCVSLRPAWAMAKTMLTGKSIKILEVEHADLVHRGADDDDTDDEDAGELDCVRTIFDNRVPFICLVRRATGQAMEYQGDRSPQDLVRFATRKAA